MLFAVDAHAIGCHLTGNEVYVRSLLNAFGAIETRSEIIAYVSHKQAAESIPKQFRTRLVSRNPFVRLGVHLPRNVARDRPDLLHVQYTAPAICAAPVVVSVHDVSFLEHPEYFTPARALQLRLTVRRTVARAAQVVTASEFSRQAIARAYRLKPQDIAVVPHAAASLFRPISRRAAAAWVTERFRIPVPFILTVGDLQPRKNQVRLIAAFAEMVRAFPELPHHLVLVGQDRFHGADVRKAAEKSGVAQRIHFTGFVGDEDLLQFYNACEFFILPSLYEGFGLPVLEAMACGRAVACSNASAVLEVADAAAILFDPHSREAMTRAMLDLALDRELRERMERLSAQRAAQFSWRNAAERTIEIYSEVARRGSRERVRSAVASLR